MATEPTPTPVHRPYIPPEAAPREFTARAVIVGALLGMVFGASSLYLVLKVGLTVSASIPVAVISLAVFRLWSKFGGQDATILENNIVQTAGSAGESIAFGLGVTMPAIMVLGFDLEIVRVMLVGLLGALLGILMMIPLRRALIVEQHGFLKYPEGTACAEVLKAGADEESRALAGDTEELALTPALSPGERENRRQPGGTANVSEKIRSTDSQFPLPRGEAQGEGELALSPQSAPRKRSHAPSATAIFAGFGIGLLYKTLMNAFKLWKDTPERLFGPPLRGGAVAAEISPELLGVGYIIGPRISCIMAAGGILSYLLLIPLIKFFGEGMAGALAPGRVPIKDMGPDEIRGAYVLYIGAGAVAAGGIISLVRSLPIILRGIRAGLADFGAAMGARATALRTDRDISMKVVGAGCLALVIAIAIAPPLHMNGLGAGVWSVVSERVAAAILIVVFGFIFVTVSSRLTGEIGSSSNPISGMTVATLLLTCLIFVIVGWTGGAYYITALSVGGIVCVAASNGGGTSQDLKTGFLLGATPKYQQIAILIGATGSALVLGPILLGLNSSGTVFVPVEKVAPGLHAPAETRFAGQEQPNPAIAGKDAGPYRIWQKTDDLGGRAGKYLVDDSGAAVWFVDPGINGAFKKREDGSEALKFQAPKAVLMSYIIKGILDRKLPWALVLFGVMISVVLELSGIPSLAFAVGVYLPISSSMPVFAGGVVRWLVDRRMRHELRAHNLDEAQLTAEGDKSPGVLLASGYIAGGAIAGIIIAFMAGVLTPIDTQITKWAEASNPFFAGQSADWLALLPFLALAGFLYLVGREVLLARKTGR